MLNSGRIVAVMALALFLASMPSISTAHCDTMDGPTVADGKLALEKGDITPALKWIGPAEEAELAAVFTHVFTVRTNGAQAKELAEQYFLETLVRLHRAGEGAPFTGLKPYGTEIPESIEAADKAIESGQVDDVAVRLTEQIQQEIRVRFQRVQELREQKDQTVEAGRAYVEAYVSYVHFIENLADMARNSENSVEIGAHNKEHHQ